MMTSLKISLMARASGSVRVRLQMMMPPKGACLSVAKALSQAALQVGIGADAAGVGVLEDGDGGLGEFLDELGGGGDIEDVVEGEFLAVELLEVLVEIAVEGGLLVGVFAVAEAGGDGEGDGEGAGGFLFAVEEIGDGAVVVGGGDEDLDAEALAELEGGGAVVGADVFEDVGVVGGIDDDGDGAVIFRGAAEHGGAADVDVLDGFLEGDVGLGDGLLEGVEVHDHEVDGQDAVFLGLFLVGFVAAEEEEAAVDFRVEGLDAAIQDFRGSR